MSYLIHQPSSISPHPSALIHQPSALRHQPSHISHQPSDISPQTSALTHQPSAIFSGSKNRIPVILSLYGNMLRPNYKPDNNEQEITITE